MASVFLMAITVERALSLYVQYVLSELIPPRPHDDGVRKKQRAFFIKISSTPDDDVMQLPETIRRVAEWLRAYNLNSANMDVEKIHSVIKEVEQLGSIFHIGRTFPDNAIKRAKSLIPSSVKPAEPEKVKDENP